MRVSTVQYAPGRSVDLYGGPSGPTVLLWHGMQTDSRRAVVHLAAAVAGHGCSVVVPDWDSHAADRGRRELLASVDFVRDHAEDPDGVTLVGWSMGGLAAAGLTLHPTGGDLRLRHTVCLAGAFAARDPISGSDVMAGAVGPGAAFTLLHGVHDDVIPPAVSTTFAANLERARWEVAVVELDADHGSIAGARYDAAVDRYAPANDPGHPARRR